MSQLIEPKQEGMLSNNAYDLMAQLIEENQSLWRIRNSYKKDSQDDEEVQQFWASLEQDKENHIKRLTELLDKRMHPR